MKYFLNKEQMGKLRDIGIHMEEINITAYEEVLETHLYDVSEGLKYHIYKNFSIDEALAIHFPFCLIMDGSVYSFSIKQEKDGWVTGYYSDKGNKIIEIKQVELIDSLYELSFLRDKLMKSL